MRCVTCGKETTFKVESTDHVIPVCDKDCWNIHMAGGAAGEAPSAYPTIGPKRDGKL